MGTRYSTYFAYGFQIPDTDPDEMDEALAGSPVSYLHAGTYDRDRTFLVTSCTEVRLGGFREVAPQTVTPQELEEWNAKLTEAAARLDVLVQAGECGWMVIPDMS